MSCTTLYITYYLKAAALLLNFLERRKVNSLPAYYSILIVFTLVHPQIDHQSPVSPRP